MNEKIATKALSMFTRYGIKWVSMNHVARELGISKRTLYEVFSSKDELLGVAIDLSLTQLWEQIARIESQASSPVKTLLQISVAVYKYITSFCAAFYADLPYYNAAQAKMKQSQEQLQETCNRHFNTGVAEGLFLEGENYNLITFVYSEFFGNNNADFQATMMRTMLRGVCTEKGCNELRTYKNLVNGISNQIQYAF